jgi:hypothetical protein
MVQPFWLLASCTSVLNLLQGIEHKVKLAIGLFPILFIFVQLSNNAKASFN